MQSLDDTRRAGQITDQDFRVIEVVIRRGHVYGARKRLTEAKRRLRPAGDLVARVRWLGEHDRCALVQLLATIDTTALRLALKLAEPGPAASTVPGSAHTPTASDPSTVGD